MHFFRPTLALLIVAIVVSAARAQDHSPLNDLLGTKELSFGGFIDTYAAYDWDTFEPRTRTYLTQPARDREPNVNLAFLEVKLSSDQYRGRLALQGGSSVDSNYASEPSSGVKYIQEAVLGTRLADGLWLDGGIYLSHIGLESWISRDNWAYTRLLASEFSPYYQSGAKLSYEPSSTWAFQLHLLNGWQNISNFDGRAAVGTQISFTSEEHWQLIHNTFLGNESEGTRFFNDFLLKSPPFGPWEAAAVFDIGTQDRNGNQDQWHTWAILTRYSYSNSLKLNARIEQYNDPEHVIVSPANEQAFQTVGFSFGFDWQLAPGLWSRTEYRAFVATDPIFPESKERTKDSDHFVVTSLSYSM